MSGKKKSHKKESSFGKMSFPLHPDVPMLGSGMGNHGPHPSTIGFGWNVPSHGGELIPRRKNEVGGRRSYPKDGSPGVVEAVFWEPEAYDRPIGPEPLQYDVPLGPHVAEERYDEPAGPARGAVLQYDHPIGPTRSLGEHIGQKASEAKGKIVSARDELYGYERTKSGKIRDSGVGRINFFEGNPFAGMDPMGVGGHPAARSFGKVGSPYRSSGRRRRSREDED
jgi:hypothetical protein